MIDVIEKDPKTYEIPSHSPDAMRNLYAGLFRTRAAQNSTANVYFAVDDYPRQFDNVATTGSYPPLALWVLPVDITIQEYKKERLTLKQAKDLAIKALLNAEKRRQDERDFEANYWAESDEA